MPLVNTVTHGQLFIRRLEPNESCLVGLIQVPDAQINESDLYYLDFRNGRLAFVDFTSETAKHTLEQEYKGCGVTSLMLAPVWTRVKVEDFSCVRFIKAFPDRNEWVVYGVASTPFMADINPYNEAWVGIKDGRARHIKPPVETVGMEPAQILDSPIWKSIDGTSYSLPMAPSYTLDILHDFYSLLADLSEGKKTKDQVEQEIITTYQYLSPYAEVDEGFAAYLAELRKATGFERLQRPLAEAQLSEIMDIVSSATKKARHHPQ